MMKWRKLGRVFCANGQRAWMRSHAAVPIAEAIEGGLYRIYFSSRDSANRSHTGWIVIDLQQPQTLVELSATPVLSPGGLGLFDDSGAMASWLTRAGNRRYMYYIGWNLGVTVPFRNALGLAISEGGAPFVRYAAGAIIDRSLHEPHFCASCCVMKDGELWRIWYLSCTGWDLGQGGPVHRYHIKYAESDDGIYWRREGHVAIDYGNENEIAISRPSVLRDADGWKMWYSHRGASYRIGYAESVDGKHWLRQDHRAGIDVSLSGWDAEMIEYPFVFDHEGQRFMLYNGNDYGRSGFGLAVLD
ncbi:hypothetical protein RP726_02960 [Candidatus Methylospira mobilis]|uniref:hypothetical protein n=1 Tax=Candidatus Methylospira mobilis TaxID=1808979 RepID=UPI0028E800C9|nr:hypothetical protein [Candidatus Methylospira mobilis]WNV05381.1 hypothetical protein RP726_02960 [Candidatus Methylospira mobilis]